MPDEQYPSTVKKEVEPIPKADVVVIYAGGTISSLATTEGYREGGHEVDLLAKLKEHDPSILNYELGQKEFAYTGLSENMDATYWEAIDHATSNALRHNPRSVLMTHGTDSMEQTANHLQEGFGEALKTSGAKIILTGANEDIEAAGTDAWGNLQFALYSAVGDANPGVYVAFHGRLIRADDVVKLPYIKDGESTFISSEDPFYKEVLATQQNRSKELVSHLESVYKRPQNEAQAMRYDVNVIRPNHQELLDRLDAMDEHDMPKAIVLTLYHSGTANTEKPEQSVAVLAESLRQRGIVVFGATENGQPTNLRLYETSVKLREAGVIPLYDMPREVALAKLRLVDPSLNPAQLIEEMLSSRAGEIDESQIIDADINVLKKSYSY